MSPFLSDLLERSLRTFVASFLATFTASWSDSIDLSSLKALGISAAMAGVTAVLALLTKQFGPNTDTASVL